MPAANEQTPMPTGGATKDENELPAEVLLAADDDEHLHGVVSFRPGRARPPPGLMDFVAKLA